MDIKCQKCGAEIRTYNKLRKWCVDCRKELINERARDRTRARWTLQNMQTNLHVENANLNNM